MKKSNDSIRVKVLEHLLYNRSITCLDALKLFNTLYLTRYIKILRKEKCNIKDKWITYTTAEGKTKRIKKYYI